jgi:hypothetical protein
MQMCDKLVFMGGSTNNIPTLDAYWGEYDNKPLNTLNFVLKSEYCCGCVGGKKLNLCLLQTVVN